MSGSKSSSSTAQSDNRVAADNGAIVSSGSSQVNIIDEFPKDVADFAKETLALLQNVTSNNFELSKSAITGIGDVAKRNQATAEGNTTTDIISASGLKAAQYLPLAVAGLGIVMILKK